MNCKRLWLAAASALVFVLNIVWRCRRSYKYQAACSAQDKTQPDSGTQKTVQPDEKQPLLDESSDEFEGEPSSQLEAVVEADEDLPLDTTPGAAEILHAAPQATDSSDARVDDGSADGVVAKEGTRQARSSTVASPTPISTRAEAKSSSSPSTRAVKSLPPALKEASTSAAKPQATVDEGYLKGLLDQEFGPPKFAVPKPATPSAIAAHGHKDSLQELLDREFGPPRFAVQKPASADEGESEVSPQPAPSAEKKPHLRLEVVSGPLCGKMFDTTDTACKLVIGRHPDCGFPIADQEISGKHAVIQYNEREACWMLTDVGSMNGTLLNGVIISVSNDDQRMAGEPHSLSDQDLVDFGSVTKVKVTCHPANTSKRARADAEASPSATVTAASLGRFRSSGLQIAQNLGPCLAQEQLPTLGASLAVHQRLGWEHKRANTGCEDVVHWEVPFAPFEGAGLFAVFDGHNGRKAADRAKEIMPGAVRAKLQAGPSSSGAAAAALVAPSAGEAGDAAERQAQQAASLREVFLDVDAQIALDEGCTATVLLAQRREGGALALQAANVGDSAVVLVNATMGQWTKLTQDHRIASSSDERSRLAAAGHHTVKNRLYGLNISRMLGDKFLKDENLGFIADPYVSEPAVVGAGERAFVIMASDGLWDVLQERRAAELVLKAASEEPQGGLTAADVADIMLSQAVTLRSKDDISVMVMQVQPQQ